MLLKKIFKTYNNQIKKCIAILNKIFIAYTVIIQ
jgi:hypothetical protein